tara:strand:- start:804 stop:1682 length:879 start_codon:yes stop_codon:yes gene_type:complete
MEHFTGVYNKTRLQVYETLFNDLFNGKVCPNVAVNLLIDVRWGEVSKALVTCLRSHSSRGEIRPLSGAFESLVTRCATVAFGTCNHADIPSWFLQNFESLIAASLHKLLKSFSASDPSDALEEEMQLAFRALFDISDGVKKFLGFAYLADSDGAHALMCSANGSRFDFLKLESMCIGRPQLVLVEMLAERISEVQGREFNAQSPFYFFARSTRWQEFAVACMKHLGEGSALARLQLEIGTSPHTAEQGLLFLASEFLERAPRRQKNGRSKTTKSSIFKGSQPFLKLVRRLIS